MKHYFIATDSTGQIHTRSTDGRIYSHCIVFRCVTDYVSPHHPAFNHAAGALAQVSWSSSRHLAEKTQVYKTSAQVTTDIVEAIEVDATTFRLTKKNNKHLAA